MKRFVGLLVGAVCILSSFAQANAGLVTVDFTSTSPSGTFDVTNTIFTQTFFDGVANQTITLTFSNPFNPPQSATGITFSNPLASQSFSVAITGGTFGLKDLTSTKLNTITDNSTVGNLTTKNFTNPNPSSGGQTTALINQANTNSSLLVTLKPFGVNLALKGFTLDFAPTVVPPPGGGGGPAAVPEPTSMALLGLLGAVGGIGYFRRRKAVKAE